mmetsp:Transcript_14535/g.49639  ORF Transcript_14535/g.49639 Transcript_14535/m.49639 type:complete len:130 (+) Transcript_14535:1869-2258(+)
MTNDFGQTPLHLAAAKASNKAITMLLKYGADTSRRHVEGLLPVEVCWARAGSSRADCSWRSRTSACTWRSFRLRRGSKQQFCCWQRRRRTQRPRETVCLTVAVEVDDEKVASAYEDAKDWWTPPDGFAN